jgi:membrane complex biogenesis BtpA family protein
MVHLPALPGSPNYSGKISDILKFAQSEAKTLEKCGFHGVLCENLGDAPYFPDNVPAETLAALAIVTDRIRNSTKLPVGVNVLRNDACSAMAIAAAARLSFIRVNVLTGAAVTDQGLLQGQAHHLLRLRQNLYAQNVAIFADLRVKHAAPLVQRDLGQEIEEYFERAGCTAIIVSGSGSGKPVEVEFLREVRRLSPHRTILIGSGLSAANAAEMLALADGAIAGTAIKLEGKIQNAIDKKRAEELARICRSCKRASD